MSKDTSALIISVTVIPRAKKQEVIPLSETQYKVKVHDAPEKGKANKEVVRLLADYFKVNKRNVRIVKGETGRSKIVEVHQ
ncbi:YggU family protein [Patescibacteria group bacterium]|nr:YggU family protein [Patescibacteria group bacterium]